MAEVSNDLIEKYQIPILTFLCERQNLKIKNNSKNMAFGISEETIEPILKEVNEGPCKESPISKEILDGIFTKLLEDALIKTYKGRKNKYILSKKAYEVAKVDMLEMPKPVRKEAMEIHENIECSKCLITDGYTSKQTKCRWCGAVLRRK